ncbi:MerR family transcriptional regulator [Marinactinospora thermotolerans]|uniref:DNA-binding transcriptional regulator, MerR family n=1 Tax=Marinactinospora thermotolerans DSM 45154 TaxID=1122192 RepID=A0A1T4PB80_9ACTN|nr:MerR family transcriptional regulator [Marinactinospora thermotolerans]SJZ88772.1 DNA-binding transcriptional regulator, MerR family [Marinactinospora thermotolerans DSM 45154]
MTGSRAGGLTIGQAAAFADVTVKTVRHYHRRGLLAEPRRDSSGYRRYGSADLLRLVQVRTLATAGVPLSEIAPLLDAGPEQFAAALTDVERRLTDQITDLIARRDRLHRVADDRALLPDRALAVLDRMTGLGFSPDYVATQREALVLFRALTPEGLDHFLTNLEHRLADPEYVDLIKRSVAAASWEPDDPRIEELATAFAANLLTHRELLVVPAGIRIGPDVATRYGLIDHHREDQSPAWARLNALVETKLRSAGVPIPHH